MNFDHFRMAPMNKTRVCYTNRFSDTGKRFKFSSSDKSWGFDSEEKNFISVESVRFSQGNLFNIGDWTFKLKHGEDEFTCTFTPCLLDYQDFFDKIKDLLKSAGDTSLEVTFDPNPKDANRTGEWTLKSDHHEVKFIVSPSLARILGILSSENATRLETELIEFVIPPTNDPVNVSKFNFDMCGALRNELRVWGNGFFFHDFEMGTLTLSDACIKQLFNFSSPEPDIVPVYNVYKAVSVPVKSTKRLLERSNFSSGQFVIYNEDNMCVASSYSCIDVIISNRN